MVQYPGRVNKGVATASGDSTFGLVEDVNSYIFPKLDDGPLYLLAVADASPMKWFQDIAIVRCDGLPCASKWVHSEPPNDLNRQILDLNKDGKHQVLVKRCACPSGEQQGGDLVYVYGVLNGQIINESATYPEFHRTVVLPGLAAKMRDATPDELNSQGEVEKRIAGLQYAQHDVERRVFGDGMAGLSDAQQWERATDDVIKALAVETYEQIDSPEADAALKRMSLLKSNYLGQRAQEELARKASKTTLQ